MMDVLCAVENSVKSDVLGGVFYRCKLDPVSCSVQLSYLLITFLFVLSITDK